MVLVTTFPFFLFETVRLGVFPVLAPGVNELVGDGVGVIRLEGTVGCGDEVMEGLGVATGVRVGAGVKEATGLGDTATGAGGETFALGFEFCAELPEF
jgi:hypothetical protein